MKQIIPKNNINGTVTIPGSKSLTHRALIAASLADGKSRLVSFLSCEDTLYTAEALKKMGINIDLKGDLALVHVRQRDRARIRALPVRRKLKDHDAGRTA